MADTLSRAYITGEPTCGAAEDIKVMVHSLVRDLPVSAGKIEEFRRSTTNDEVLQQLRDIMNRGWPRKLSSLPRGLQDY